MTYDYRCEKCDFELEITKKLRHADRAEYCNQCGNQLQKLMSNFMFQGAAVEEREWHPAFGKALTKSEARAEAKAKGLIEVGNENIHKHIKGPERKDYMEGL